VACHDFEKMSQLQWSALCYKVLDKQNLTEFLSAVRLAAKDNLDEIKDGEELEKFESYVTAFFNSRRQSLGPMSAFIGGFVSQEIIKCITQKFIPIN
jgi:hypothetical protein